VSGVTGSPPFVVSPHFGTPPAAELLRQQLILALAGELDVMAALERRDTDAAANQGRAGETPDAVPVNRVTAPPRVLWHSGGAADQLVVEIRSMDRPGLLARLTGVFERAGVDISWAKVTTLGSTVVDAFCISVPPLDQRDVRAALERDLYAVLPTPPPAKPAEAAG